MAFSALVRLAVCYISCQLESGNQCHYLLPYATNNDILCLLAYVMKLELFGIHPWQIFPPASRHIIHQQFQPMTVLTIEFLFPVSLNR